MRRATRLLAPLAGALALVMAFPALATASPAPTPPKTVSFSASSYSVSEAAGHATITVRRPAGGAKITVRFATCNHTAVAPRDYTTTVRTLTFPAGSNSTTVTVPVPVRNNSVANADRTFTVTLSQPSGGYRLVSPSTATVRIVNDDVPAAPSGLTATAVGSHEIDLHWGATSDYVTGYQILRSTTSGGPYTQAGTSTTNSYSDTGLAAGTYYYVVQAVNPAGTSPSSEEASATLTPAQTQLVYNGGFEDGLTAGWYVGSSDGSTTTLDSTAPHSGTYSAHLATDGSQTSYPSMEGSFNMPSSGTVTFTAWYKAALAAGDVAHISVYDYDAQEYVVTDFVTTSAANWTETDPLVMDASTRPGHLMLILVDMVAGGVSSFDVDDFTAVAN